MKEIGKVKLFALVNIIITTVSGAVGLVGRYVFLRSDNVTYTGGADLPAKVITTSEPVSALLLFDILIKISIVVAVIALIGVGYFIVKSKNDFKGKGA